MKKLTHEEFVSKVLNINPNIEILSVYQGAKNKIQCKCKICENKWDATASNLYRYGCPKCRDIKNSQKFRNSVDKVLYLFNQAHGNKYDYSEMEYINCDTKIKIICPIHGVFYQTPYNHQKGHGCPKCALEKQAKKRTKTTEQFIEQANKIHKNKYNYSKTVYTKAQEKVIITCPIHGDFEQTAYEHLQGYNCPKCSKHYIPTTQEWIEKAKQIHGDKYDYSKVEYINSNTPVCIICPKHGPFWQRPNDHVSKKCGCPRCNKSHGESIIEKYLKENCIKYLDQYGIDIPENIRISKNTFIDFYLPDFNIFIEYNGIQHYIPQEHFGGKLKFDKQVIRDNYVRDYCKKNNIKLVEISYDKSEIEILKILEDIIYE